MERITAHAKTAAAHTAAAASMHPEQLKAVLTGNFQKGSSSAPPQRGAMLTANPPAPFSVRPQGNASSQPLQDPRRSMPSTAFRQASRPGFGREHAGLRQSAAATIMSARSPPAPRHAMLPTSSLAFGAPLPAATGGQLDPLMRGTLHTPATAVIGGTAALPHMGSRGASSMTNLVLSHTARPASGKLPGQMLNGANIGIDVGRAACGSVHSQFSKAPTTAIPRAANDAEQLAIEFSLASGQFSQRTSRPAHPLSVGTTGKQTAFAGVLPTMPPQGNVLRTDLCTVSKAAGRPPDIASTTPALTVAPPMMQPPSTPPPKQQAIGGPDTQGKLPVPLSPNSKLAAPNGLAQTPPMGQTSKASSPALLQDGQNGPLMFARPDFPPASLAKGVSTNVNSFNDDVQTSTGPPLDALLRRGDELLRNVAATAAPPLQQISNIQQVNHGSASGQQGNQPQDVHEVLRRGEELLRQVSTWQPPSSPGQASANGGCPAPGNIASNPAVRMSGTGPPPSSKHEDTLKDSDETTELLRRGEELLRQAGSQDAYTTMPSSARTNEAPTVQDSSSRKGLLPEGLPFQGIPWKAAPQGPPKGLQ